MCIDTLLEFDFKTKAKCFMTQRVVKIVLTLDVVFVYSWNKCVGSTDS